MKKLNHEEIWTKYGKMIMKVAYNLSKKYSRPYDELLSEGVLNVFKNLHKWDSNRSNLCTYIYRCAYFKILDHCMKRTKSEQEIPTDVYNGGDKNPFLQKVSPPNWFQNFLNELTEETKHLVQIIFESPEELYEAVKPTSPKRSQDALRRYMIDVLDWTSIEIDKAFKELFLCL